MAERGSSGSRRERKRVATGNFFTRWRRRRRMVREAKHLLKEARRILRRHSYRIKDDVAAEVRAAMEALRQALKPQTVTVEEESPQSGKVESAPPPGGGPYRRPAKVRRRSKAAVRLEELRERLEKLDELVDKHLAFGRKSAIREYTESIGVAVLVALLLRAFVVEAFKIPSGSMIPTLEVGDHIFVNKFIYGLRIPWTHIKFMEVRKPRRGEVIVFVYPQDESKDFIKRIIAVEGDTIAVDHDQVILNGKPIKRRQLPGPCVYPDAEEGSSQWEPRNCTAYLEELDGVKYRVIQDSTHSASDRKPIRIPPGHVFVMGDNRDNSHDSRFWGTVPDTAIKGKAMIIWWSSGDPDGVRWRRFFDLVHSAPDLSKPVQP
jgi:signal peptidase I